VTAFPIRTEPQHETSLPIQDEPVADIDFDTISFCEMETPEPAIMSPREDISAPNAEQAPTVRLPAKQPLEEELSAFEIAFIPWEEKQLPAIQAVVIEQRGKTAEEHIDTSLPKTARFEDERFEPIPSEDAIERLFPVTSDCAVEILPENLEDPNTERNDPIPAIPVTETHPPKNVFPQVETIGPPLNEFTETETLEPITVLSEADNEPRKRLFPQTSNELPRRSSELMETNLHA